MEVEKVNRAILVGLLAASLVAEVTAASQLQVKWAVNTSDVFQARTFGAGHMAAQTVWDVDGDGTKEVVFGTRRETAGGCGASTQGATSSGYSRPSARTGCRETRQARSPWSM